MKRIITVLMLVAALLAGGASAEAKTAKKKSSSSASSSVKFGQLYDGYADIGGHTYSGTLQGIKLTVSFGPYSPSNGTVRIKASYNGQWEEEINNWYYEGDGIVMFYMDGGSPCYYEIRNGGKELYNEEANFTLKVTK